MKIARPDLAALGLVALCVVAAAVLTALRVPVPDLVVFAGTTALGVAGGSYLPTPQSSSAPTQEAPAPVAAAPGAPAALAYDPAATGVFRAATHAPR